MIITHNNLIRLKALHNKEPLSVNEQKFIDILLISILSCDNDVDYDSKIRDLVTDKQSISINKIVDLTPGFKCRKVLIHTDTKVNNQNISHVYNTGYDFNLNVNLLTLEAIIGIDTNRGTISLYNPYKIYL